MHMFICCLPSYTILFFEYIQMIHLYLKCKILTKIYQLFDDKNFSELLVHVISTSSQYTIM